MAQVLLHRSRAWEVASVVGLGGLLIGGDEDASVSALIAVTGRRRLSELASASLEVSFLPTITGDPVRCATPDG
jgi:hypothetical protein